MRSQKLDRMQESYTSAERLFRQVYAHLSAETLEAYLESNRDAVRLHHRIEILELKIERLTGNAD